MFERGPWKDCPKCDRPGTLGVLMAGAHRLDRRCTNCREIQTETLPLVEKAVIYLDQSALSEMFKIDTGTRRANAPHEEFWTKLNSQVKRVLLLQQAIFPASDIHSSETTVFRFAHELRAASKRIDGDVSFLNSEDVKRRQVWAFADAYMDTMQAPVLNLAVDGILRGSRNLWLPDMRVHVNADYSAFADGIREHRAAIAAGMLEFLDKWAKEKPTFQEVLKLELEAYGRDHKRAYHAAISRMQEAFRERNIEAVLIEQESPVVVQHKDLMQKFMAVGFDRADARELVMQFWDWPELQQLPVHKISAYLYAAIARKIVAGQKRPPSQGMMNDVTAIATYGPYVDAMFVDNECAALLAEAPLPQALKLKARVFCLNTQDQFLAYLTEIEAQTPPEVRPYAEIIYGLKCENGPAKNQ